MKNMNHLQPGLYPGLSFEEYHAYGRFGGSDAAYLATHSPAHWRAQRRQVATPAMQLGTAAHCLLLEGREEFEKRYIVKPGFDRRTKNGKESHLEFVAAHAGKTILTPAEYNTIVEMQSAMHQSNTAMDILEECWQRELSVFWTCSRSDVACCGRFDFAGVRIVGDLKTTSDASPAGFLNSVKRFNYHVQAGHYLDGIEECDTYPEAFYFIAIETSPPYGIGIYELDEAMLNEGRRLAITARMKLMEAEQYGYWGYKDAVVKLSFKGCFEKTTVIEL